MENERLRNELQIARRQANIFMLSHESDLHLPLKGKPNNLSYVVTKWWKSICAPLSSLSTLSFGFHRRQNREEESYTFSPFTKTFKRGAESYANADVVANNGTSFLNGPDCSC
ncbi:hypothetical protein TSAR_007265 [Trichomalopsis sarcophagae]|uniref:Uncharacterized protein n=1 Tax=Trichomalopsis sarcophagae TaxID=543379 RepID=A0A232EGG6_9HYME|nr:hypothetical protein TSAR_007265 [Trichomalopsis sarcophagae]